MLIDYNARFGDPECLNLLSLLEDDVDFSTICAAAANGTLSSSPPLRFKPLASCCKYAVPIGYPDKSCKGFEIDLSKLKSRDFVYTGAVDQIDFDGPLIATGSRTVGVVGLGPTLEEAEAVAEAEVSAISGKLFHRKDIGTATLVAARVKHMLSTQMQVPARRIRTAVLGSTRGSSMVPILRAIASGDLSGVEIVTCLSNKQDAQILTRARLHGIAAEYVPVSGQTRDEYDWKLTEKLRAMGVELIILIGYMRILSASFCDQWQGRALNIHPSLLPAFAGGMDIEVHRAVLRAKVPESGCTVHFVEKEVDGGGIVVQKRCPVTGCNTAEELKTRVQYLEGGAMCEAIAKVAAQLGGVASYISAQDSSPISYASSGVSIDTGNALVEKIKPMAKATIRPGSLGGLGGFGGLFDLQAAGYSDPILVSGTDGVGTKLLIAQAAELHDTIGIDLVAMVVNDLIVQGAEPLFFLDYFASGKLELGAASSVVRGIADGCKACNCALVGGETAEMPGMYSPGHYDLAGFAVGAVERGNLLPKIDSISAGDVIVGIRSSGVHSNGFSFVRKCVERAGLRWNDPAPFETSQNLKLGEALLTPTKLYVRSCLSCCRTGKVKALAHITGGGLIENLPRVLPHKLKACIDAHNWSPQPVFQWLARVSNSRESEMLRTFNCGIGMALVVAGADAATITAAIEDAGDECSIIGRLEENHDHTAQVVVKNTDTWGWSA